MLFNLVTIILLLSFAHSFNWEDVSLPPEHIPYYMNAYPSLRQSCSIDENCPFRNIPPSGACWGYERGCEAKNAYAVQPHCPGDHKGWVKTKKAQIDTFYSQADFGYVKEHIEDLMVMCEPTFAEDSSLECSKYLRFCRGRNIMMNFTGLIGRGDNLRYKTDILAPGQIGGHCNLHKQRLLQQAEHMSALQSWGPEMVNFVELDKPISEKTCDIIIEKPTYIMKLDAAVNMYHHFCDFFNLYASLHVNSTHPAAFHKDNQMLVWETFTYDSAFKETWRAFSTNPIWDLKKFRGDVVCFKNVVFPLLPRMIFGLFYNTPVIYGCERSGLFHAFTTHILHALDIKKEKRTNDKIRITILSRGTRYRQMLNEKELVDALRENEDYEVRRVVYDRSVPFTKQLEMTHNSDVFVGMHGAGLTHMLFLPDWAAVFEVYNCEDPGCYADLARLRGLKYVTWEDNDKLTPQDEGHHPDHGGSHAKFTNYSFVVAEFVRLVKIAADHVKQREDFNKFIAECLGRQLASDNIVSNCENELSTCESKVVIRENGSDQKEHSEQRKGTVDTTLGIKNAHSEL